MFTKRVEMVANRFEDNWGAAAYGLLLKEITDSRLTSNVFRGNTTGLLADGASRLVATDNEFAANGWAVKLDANTQDGRFEGNEFVGNTFDVATNSREHSTTFAGNYWDEYRGYDLNRDGIGDVPHRPVRLFSLLVARNQPSLILLRSAFVTLLDAAERVLPALTPEMLVDATPSMRRRRPP
jgi:nitrous oxidase accessory protein